MRSVHFFNEKPNHYNWYQSSSDPRELFENTKKSVDLDSGRTLVVTVYDLRYPVTEDLLDTIFSVYGLIEKIEIVPAEDKFQASLVYKSPFSAKSARSLHGRYIYERCNLLSVEYAEESLNEEFSEYASTEERNRDIMAILKQMSATIDTLFAKLNKPAPPVPDYTSACCSKWTPVQESVYSKEKRSEAAKNKVVQDAPKVFAEIPEREFKNSDEKIAGRQLFDEKPMKETVRFNEVSAKIFKARDVEIIDSQLFEKMPVKDKKEEEVAFHLFDEMSVKKMKSENSLDSFISVKVEENQKITLEGGSGTTYGLSQFEMNYAPKENNGSFEENERQCNKGKISCTYIHDEVVVKLFDPGGYSVGLGKLILLALSNFNGVLAEIGDTHFDFFRAIEMTRPDDIHKSDRIADNLSITHTDLKNISWIDALLIIGIEHVNVSFVKVLHQMKIRRPDTENEFLISSVYNPLSDFLHDFDLVLLEGAILCLIDSPGSSVYFLVPLLLEGILSVSLKGAAIVLALILDIGILRRNYLLKRFVGSLYWKIHISRSSATHYETDVLFMGMLYKWLCFEGDRSEVDIHGNILEYLNKSKDNIVRRFMTLDGIICALGLSWACIRETPRFVSLTASFFDYLPCQPNLFCLCCVGSRGNLFFSISLFFELILIFASWKTLLEMFHCIPITNTRMTTLLKVKKETRVLKLKAWEMKWVEWIKYLHDSPFTIAICWCVRVMSWYPSILRSLRTRINSTRGKCHDPEYGVVRKSHEEVATHKRHDPEGRALEELVIKSYFLLTSFAPVHLSQLSYFVM